MTDAPTATGTPDKPLLFVGQRVRGPKPLPTNSLEGTWGAEESCIIESLLFYRSKGPMAFVRFDDGTPELMRFYDYAIREGEAFLPVGPRP